MNGIPKAGGAAPRRSGALVLTVLLLVNVLNFIDRHLPFILIAGIKADLQLSDTQIALMTGVSFALLYSLAALPLGFLADRGRPSWILAGCLAVWSVMTGLSGLSRDFVQLLLCRIGVAATEAGSTPAAHAVIARTVPENRRGWALAIFSLGVPIGSTLGLGLGGWINDLVGWRAAFMIVGLPGLILAVICIFALPGAVSSAATERHAEPSFAGVMRMLWRFRSFRAMTLANTFYAASSYGINAFAPSFLMRVHGLTSTRTGLLMGVVYGVGGVIGTLGGGLLADRLSRRDEAWRLRIPAFGQLLSVPTALAAWLVGDVILSTVFLTLAYMFGLLAFAPSFAAAQSLVPDTIRATTSAVMLFFMTLVGASLGPLAVGWISDALAMTHGTLSLRYALSAMAMAAAFSSGLFYVASLLFPAELPRRA